MVLTAGAVFAGYRIERTLGSGGMGTVYLARHPRLPRSVALKVLDPIAGADPEFRARFQREAELAVQLDHPNVVEIYDRGAEGDLLWMSMRYVAGPDVAELIRRAGGGLPAARAVEIVAQAAAGLDSAHRRGLLHRDVKPANLLVADDDGADHVFVTDFGIARSRADDSGLTEAGALLATLGYVAPEQIRGDTLDHRADVYALGATLHQMLTGALPFVRTTPAAVLGAHLMEPPPRPSAAVPGLPAALDAVIATAMAKDREQRYPDCRALATAARAALVRPEAAPSPPATHPGATTPPATEGTAARGASGFAAPPAPPGASPARSRRPDPAPRPPGTHASGPQLRPGGPGAGVTGPEAPGAGAPQGGAGIGAGFGGSSAAGPAWRGPTARPLLAAAAVLAALALLTTVVVAATRSGDTVAGTGTPATSTAAPATSTTTTSPATTRPVNPAWGRDSELAALFPRLLPDAPSGTGYRGARCTGLNVLNNGGAPAIECAQDDGVTFTVWSFRPGDPRREDMFTTDIENDTTREEPWTRPSGTGRVRWSHYPGANTGLLTVAFDDPARARVVIDVGWDFHTGDDLWRDWWANAPL